MKDIDCAKKCQMIIGSFEKDSLSCDCLGSLDCRLTSDERELWKLSPEVNQAMTDCYERYLATLEVTHEL